MQQRGDFNEDGSINFREFTGIVHSVAHSGGPQYDLQKSLQLNCSECIGMENYNLNVAEAVQTTHDPDDMCYS